MKIRKCMMLCMTACLCLGGLNGCNDNKVNYVQEDEKDQTEKGSSDLTQFADAQDWEDRWTVTDKDGNTVTVSVSAKIKVPEEDAMSVIEVKRPEMDTAYKESMLKAVFGETGFHQDDTYVPEDSTDPFEKWIEAADAYIGTRNGVSYRMVFLQEQEDWISLYPLDTYQVAMDELSALKGVYYEEGSTAYASSNTCSLTEEEAIDMAEKFLEECGFPEQTCIKVYPLLWTGGEEYEDDLWYNTQEIVNGYVLYFLHETEEATSVALGSIVGDQQSVEWTGDVENRNPQVNFSEPSMSHTVLYVTESGVILMDIMNPYELADLTEEVELLPLETIQRIIQNELTEHLEDYNGWESDDLSFDSMRLTYGLLQDDTKEGYYSFIPVWELSSASEFGPDEILVNAIDGSMISWSDILTLGD